MSGGQAFIGPGQPGIWCSVDQAAVKVRYLGGLLHKLTIDTRNVISLGGEEPEVAIVRLTSRLVAEPAIVIGA